MKRTLALAAVVVLSCATGTAQTTPQDNSPKIVVEKLLKMGLDGEIMTDEGLNRARTFFVHPVYSPPGGKIAVFGKDFSILNERVTANSTEIDVDIDPEGEIDSTLKYSEPTKHTYKSAIVFHLVLSDKYWELEPDGKTPKQVTGTPGWKIEDSDAVLWLGADSALRYVAERRNKTSDSTTRRNAEITIGILKRLR